jgi:rRNA maturation endonuclease Nob1
MSSEKSVIILPPPPKHVCPVCGRPAYSLGGVHPQCAIEQADEPRILKLRAAKAAQPKKTPGRQVWKKRCPQCGTESHISRKICKCGHNFVKKQSNA